MDTNQPFDTRGFGIAFALVALPAALVLVFGAVAGRIRAWLRPTWAFPVRPWNGFAIVLAFGVYYVLMLMATQAAAQGHWFDSADESARKTLEGIAARLIATPLFFACVAFALTQVHGPLRRPRLGRLAGGIALGSLAWFVIAPATIAVHMAALKVKQEIGGPIDQHPLAKLHPAQDGFGGALIGLAVCVLTPLFEEYFFRGLLLPWAMRAAHRPWILIGWPFLFAQQVFGDLSDPHYGAVLFAACGALVLGLCQVLPKTRPKRTVLAIVSTSVFFAAVHSSVWPSPIPLFVLALGLGYLTARTGSIVPAVVVHGLFNAVSFVYLLRGPAG